MNGNNGRVLNWMHSFGNLRVSLAMIAMLGAMWAAVDLHQHLTGLHKPVECTTCSIEQSVSHGFAPQADIQAGVETIDDADNSRFPLELAIASQKTTCIRAPPLI